MRLRRGVMTRKDWTVLAGCAASVGIMTGLAAKSAVDGASIAVAWFIFMATREYTKR